MRKLVEGGAPLKSGQARPGAVNPMGASP